MKQFTPSTRFSPLRGGMGLLLRGGVPQKAAIVTLSPNGVISKPACAIEGGII
jgi:hypothetical protein